MSVAVIRREWVGWRKLALLQSRFVVLRLLTVRAAG